GAGKLEQLVRKPPLISDRAFIVGGQHAEQWAAGGGAEQARLVDRSRTQDDSGFGAARGDDGNASPAAERERSFRRENADAAAFAVADHELVGGGGTQDKLRRSAHVSPRVSRMI